MAELKAGTVAHSDLGQIWCVSCKILTASGNSESALGSFSISPEMVSEPSCGAINVREISASAEGVIQIRPIRPMPDPLQYPSYPPFCQIRSRYVFPSKVCSYCQSLPPSLGA